MKTTLGAHLGSGAGSDVFEYGPDKVCKLYVEKYDRSLAEYEYNKTQMAYDSGLPTPKLYDIIEHEGRFGIVMERIHGKSYMSVLMEHITVSHQKGAGNAEIFHSPVVADMIHDTARILYSLHQKECALAETAQDALQRHCLYYPELNPEEKAQVMELISRLETGTSVCHGDPNPGNLLLTESGIAVIDWINCVKGCPYYDLMEYSVEALEDIPEYIADFLSEYQGQFTAEFFAAYRSLSDFDEKDLEKWRIPMLVSKTGGNNPPRKQARLLRDIRERLKHAGTV